MQLCKQSPYIIPFIDELEVEDNVYLVTKYARGGNLLNYLNARGITRLPENLALMIFMQIAHGLYDIHSSNVVHRDLKHLNIFLSNNSDHPTVKIGDFGMACMLNEDECIRKIAGTVGFMAPEVL